MILTVKVLLGVVLVAVVGLFIILEIGLRELWGFGNPLIYIGDDQIGYLLAPNQRTRRNGNRIEINQYSMRSQQLEKSHKATTFRVLLLGDSIANGGWWTDQPNTISNLIERSLANNLPSQFTSSQVLNASANSWGPRNELAYLRKFGTFDAQVVVLLLNTDDLFATAPTSLPVGRDRNYPDKKPPLALAEVWERYIRKPKPNPQLQAVQNESGDRVGVNLEAIALIEQLVRENQSRFLLAMTPLLREIGTPGPRDYEIKARHRLSNFTEQKSILYIDFLPTFNSTQNPKALYHDHIHLNLQGNQLVTEKISSQLSGVSDQ